MMALQFLLVIFVSSRPEDLQHFGHEPMGTETRGACGSHSQTVVLHHRHVPGG